jgi:fatty-acyl-CoA synthase
LPGVQLVTKCTETCRNSRHFGAAGHAFVLARNSHGFAALRFALARLGAVMVPVNFMLNADEVAYILRHAGAQAAGHRQRPGRAGPRRGQAGHAIERLPVAAVGRPQRARPAAANFDDLAATAGAPPRLPRAASGQHDLLQIVYTSGTESCPRAPC